MKTAIYLRSFVVATLAVACAGAAHAAMPSARPLRSLDLPVTTPGRMVCDASGNVYVSDPAQGRVYLVDAFGRAVKTNSSFGRPCALALQPSGNLLVGDALLGRVLVTDAAMTTVQSVLGQGAQEFLLPGGIAVWETNSTIWVADSLANQVKVYSDSVRVLTIGSRGAAAGQFDFPAAICISPQGEALVIDQNNDRVQRFSASGIYLGAFALQDPALRGRSGRGQGVACDESGRVYVADSFQGLIRVYGAQGGSLGAIGGYGQLLGQLSLPMDLAIDSQSRLLVANTGNRRVDVFGLDCYNLFAASPARRVVGIGSIVTFQVSHGCPASYTYQWSKGGVPLVDGAVVSGSSTATLQLSGVSTLDTGWYSVQVFQAGFPAASASAELVVVANPAQGFLPEDPDVPAQQLALILNPDLAVLPPLLTIEQRPDGDLVLNWDNPAYTLESAVSPDGQFLPVVGGVAPWVVVRDEVDAMPSRYFRLRSP